MAVKSHPTLPRLCTAVLTAGSVLMGPSSVALAQPRPQLSWTLPTSAIANWPVTFRWRASHLTASSYVVVQEQQQGGGPWVTVLDLHSHLSGSASIAGLHAGTYRLRLAALRPDGAVLAVTPARTLVENASSAKLAFSNDEVGSGSPIEFGYSTRNLPAGSLVELQRQVGFDHVWENVLSTPVRSGVRTVPGVPLGAYAYRLQVVDAKRVVVTSNVALLWSYGNVPLLNICNANNNININPNGNILISMGCVLNTVQVGASILTYLIEDTTATSAPNYSTVIKAGDTSCRSITVQWALDNNAAAGDSATVEVVQADASPQSATTTQGTIGDTTFSLTGSPFYLNDWIQSSNGDNVYINGTMSCYTGNGNIIGGHIG